MAYGISHFFPGGAKSQYEAIMAAMNGKLGVIPKGRFFMQRCLRPATGRSSPFKSPRKTGTGLPRNTSSRP